VNIHCRYDCTNSIIIIIIHIYFTWHNWQLEINESYHSETRQLAVQLVITREKSSVFSLCLKILIDSEDLTNSDKSFQTDSEARDVIWGGQGGHCSPPLNFKNSEFFVFLPTKYLFSCILPPSRNSVKILAHPWKKLKWRPWVRQNWIRELIPKIDYKKWIKLFIVNWRQLIQLAIRRISIFA